MAKIKMKIFTIIKEVSQRIPDKNFVKINGNPLWWHLLSELDGLDVTVNTDSQKFLKQLSNSNLKSIQIVKSLYSHLLEEQFLVNLKIYQPQRMTTLMNRLRLTE